jgi:hypothetical protein
VSIANAAGCRLQSPACIVDTAQDTCNSLYHLFVQDGGAGEEESLDQSDSLFGPFHRGSYKAYKASFSEDLSFSPRLTKRHMGPLLVQRKQHLWPVRTAVTKVPVSPYSPPTPATITRLVRQAQLAECAPEVAMPLPRLEIGLLLSTRSGRTKASQWQYGGTTAHRKRILVFRIQSVVPDNLCPHQFHLHV